MGLNEDLGDRENVGSAALSAQRIRETKEHFNQLTPKRAERLAVLAEECGEVIQATMKILRHGYESYNPDSANQESNRHHLSVEIGHVFAAVDLLGLDVSAFDINTARSQKTINVKRYLHHD